MGGDKRRCETVCSLMLILCLKVEIAFKEDTLEMQQSTCMKEAATEHISKENEWELHVKQKHYWFIFSVFLELKYTHTELGEILMQTLISGWTHLISLDCVLGRTMAGIREIPVTSDVLLTRLLICFITAVDGCDLISAFILLEILYN